MSHLIVCGDRSYKSCLSQRGMQVFSVVGNRQVWLSTSSLTDLLLYPMTPVVTGVFQQSPQTTAAPPDKNKLLRMHMRRKSCDYQIRCTSLFTNKRWLPRPAWSKQFLRWLERDRAGTILAEDEK